MTKTFATMKLSVDVKVWDDMPFTLKQEIASGTYGEHDYEILQNVSTKEIYIKFKGQVYEVSMQQLMHALMFATEDKES